MASSTTMTALLPEWAMEGGSEAVWRRLTDAQSGRDLLAGLQASGVAHDPGWDQVLVSSAPHRPEYEGRPVADLATQAGRGPDEWLLDALLDACLGMNMVSFGMSEENLERALRHPATMIGTDGLGLPLDGPLARGKPHPRS